MVRGLKVLNSFKYFLEGVIGYCNSVTGYTVKNHISQLSEGCVTDYTVCKNNFQLNFQVIPVP